MTGYITLQHNSAMNNGSSVLLIVLQNIELHYIVYLEIVTLF